ncbi:MAG: hypothetical protein HYV27_08930 [Candidatus Hydrogenedentes bacterium]|nr:hypothetical protein [Candidatus Hydrogenedentota bacterium]
MNAGNGTDHNGIIQGAGGYSYRWVDHWARMPQGRAFGKTHGICESSDGRIFVHNTSADAVAIFDSGGVFLGSWGGEFAEHAHGMQWSLEDGREYLYLAPTKMHCIVKTTLDGEEIFRLDYPKESGKYESAEKFIPTNIAIAPNGDFYVADGYGSHYIHQYTRNAEYVRTWGGPGTEPGQMLCPHGIWVDTRGPEPVIVVADRKNIRLQYFTLDGDFLRIDTPGFLHPCHFDQRGEDLLVPDLFGRVTLLDKHNTVIAHLGENPGIEKVPGYPDFPRGAQVPGKFIAPHDACFDRAGNIFVVEWVNGGRVTKLELLP